MRLHPLLRLTPLHLDRLPQNFFSVFNVLGFFASW